MGIDRIWWYFAVVSLGAVSGGLFPFINCGFAAVADLTKDQIASNRATVFGIVQVSIFVGLTVGPIVGGLIADRVSVRLSLIFSACCSARSAQALASITPRWPPSALPRESSPSKRARACHRLQATSYEPHVNYEYI